MSNDNIKFSRDLFERKEVRQFAMETRHIKPNNIDPSTTHFHDFYEILYYYQGSRNLTVNNTTAVLNENTVAFIAPYKLHKTSNADNNGCKRILINFTYDFIQNLDDKFDNMLLTCFHSPTNAITFSAQQSTMIRELFQSLLYEYSSKKDAYSPHIVTTMLVQLLLFSSRTISNTTSAITSTTASAYYTKILNIADYIKNNYQQKISLDLLSEKFSINKYVISREFKRIMDLSFVDYVNSIRINSAQALLLNSNSNITAIAYECGFDSLVHFERTFKKQTQMTAQDYMKKNRIIDKP